MPEDDSEWMGALLRPSSAISAGGIIVGVWFVFLTILNIMVGAFAEGRKVLWIDFLTNGADTNAEWEMGILVDDVLFGGIGFAILFAGVLGMNKVSEDGVVGWIGGLTQDPLLTSLLSTESGITRTLASWMILAGASFYLVWSALNTTWVDPGVYSVMIAFVSFGVGLHLLQGSESDQ